MSSLPPESVSRTELISRSAELLGPVIEYYLGQLDAHLRYLDDGQTCFLFVTRSGLRILRAYERYLSRMDADLPHSSKLFWASRLLVCIGISRRQPELAITTIGQEFIHTALGDTLRFIMSAKLEQEGSTGIDLGDLPTEPLHRFFLSDHSAAKRLRAHLNEQSGLFERYLKATVGDAKRVVLIDTGWTGTAQKLLARAFPDYEWLGFYFGWMGNPEEVETGSGSVTGLVFNAQVYDPSRPETAIALHRHLIESLFEPNAPSIELLALDAETSEVIAPGSQSLIEENPDGPGDHCFLGVMEHLAQCSPTKVADRFISYQRAVKELAHRLVYPSMEDTLLLEGKARSADFGRRALLVPVLVRDAGANGAETREQRIGRSLWPEGQIALELPPDKAKRALERRAATHAPLRVRSVTPGPRPVAPKGRVAIITRTKDRPLLLERAARSVAAQTYSDYVWVVINDGGDPDVVVEVLDNSSVAPHQILFHSNERSIGMEAASNIGIRASRSELIIIHDDDDSWHPEFLSKAVGYLEAPNGAKYGGVITHSLYVSEEISGEKIIEWGRYPYQDWVQHVQLTELVIDNFFPPIAFLFRRTICESIGCFDESLPVLGDWDFNIRFLMRADIGVLPEHLAYYHHRDRGNAGSYSNSVVGSISKHVEFNAIVRNNFFRKAALRPEWMPAAVLVAQGYAQRDVRHRLLSKTQGAAASQMPAPSAQSTPDSLVTADLRWCMVQAAREHYRGPLGLMRRFLPFPSDAVLLRSIRKAGIKPPPDFDDAAYLQRYPDVAQQVSKGAFMSGFEHYFKFGRAEGRTRPTLRA